MKIHRVENLRGIITSEHEMFCWLVTGLIPQASGNFGLLLESNLCSLFKNVETPTKWSILLQKPESGKAIILCPKKVFAKKAGTEFFRLLKTKEQMIEKLIIGAYNHSADSYSMAKIGVPFKNSFRKSLELGLNTMTTRI